MFAHYYKVIFVQNTKLCLNNVQVDLAKHILAYDVQITSWLL